MKGKPLQNTAFRLAQACLVLLPFNITFFLGERRVMPADLVLPLLVMAVLPALPAVAGKLWREDRPVLLYFALVLAAAAAACVTGGIRSIDPLALAPVSVALALYLSFRAAGESRERVLSLLGLWAVVSTVAAAVSIAALLLAMSGIGNPLVRWYPNLGPGAWRIIGTAGQTPNFGYSS